MRPNVSRLLTALPFVAGALSLLACGAASERDLWRVEKKEFLHQIRAEGQLRAAETLKLTVPREAEQSLRLAWLADDGKRVVAGEVVARFDRQPLETKRLNGERDLEKARLDARRLDRRDAVQQGTLSTSHEVAALDLAFAQKFQKKDEQVFSKKVIAESSIDQGLAEARQASTEDALGTQKRLARTELDLVEIAKRKAAADLETARKGLEALEVRAPHDGVFLRARLWSGDKLEPGGEMWPGVEVGELPRVAQLQAEVYVLEADAGGLAEGQEAEVRIDAHPERVYGAKITRLDAAARPRFRGSPVQYFAITLTFDDAEVEGKLGQRITARLTVGRRDAALVLPRQAIEQVDGKSVVQVRRGSETVPVEVTLGPASAGRVVVESGLAEGDLVVLPRGKGGSAESGGGAATSKAAAEGQG